MTVSKSPSRSTHWFIPAGTPYLQVRMTLRFESGGSCRLSYFRDIDPDDSAIDYPEGDPATEPVKSADVEIIGGEHSTKDVEYGYLDLVQRGSLLFKYIADEICGSTWERENIWAFFIPDNDKDVDAVVFHKDKVIMSDV